MPSTDKKPAPPRAAASSAPTDLASPAAACVGLRRFLPHTIIFFSSGCIMIVELLAGRLIARHLGSSLYTWTSIIGVVLAGMSVGNFLGGRLADRFAARRLLGWLFLASSIACAACLGLNRLVEIWAASGSLARVGYPVRVFVSTAFIFLLPALALGTISPVTAKMALERGLAVGGTLGSIYAWGAVGSIVGTFAAGYWLIAVMGSRPLALAVALALALLGLAVGPARVVHAFWALAVAAALWVSCTAKGGGFLFQEACSLGLQDGQLVKDGGREVYQPFLFAKDSAYQFVQVSEDPGNDPTVWRTGGRLLVLDCRRHGYVDVSDANHLEFRYEKIYGWLTRKYFGGRPVESALFLGGGSYTFPRWVLAQWGSARCDVAEVDPVVPEACRKAMGLTDDPRIRTFENDARIVVNELPASARYDLIIGDAFSDLSVPWHLTTLEFQRRLKKHLRPGGVMLTNVIDNYVRAGGFLGAYVETVSQVFEHVHVLTTHSAGPQDWQANFVVVAYDGERPDFVAELQAVQPGRADWAISLLGPEHLAHIRDRCGGRVLTDDWAPVEVFLAPAAQ